MNARERDRWDVWVDFVHAALVLFSSMSTIFLIGIKRARLLKRRRLTTNSQPHISC
jgi:hypothetical protein